MSYAAVSVSFKGNYRERNYAEMFVDIDKYTPITKTLLYGKEPLTSRISKSVAAISWRRPNKTSFDYFQFKIR
jgi:hypothetical protein